MKRNERKVYYNNNPSNFNLDFDFNFDFNGLERFNNLKKKTEAIELFKIKTLEILKKYSFLEITNYSGQDCYVKRGYELDDNLNSFVILEDLKIIGFITYSFKKKICKIDRIAIDEFSKRRSGLTIKLNIENSDFTVGIGHSLVLNIIMKLENEYSQIEVEAISDESKYIFKSLGFVEASSKNTHSLLYKKL
ncbi:hypothetical protein [Fusobacterium sp. MFO224]|uniref:hypothetical protein n=1 Tax=Fusobacterium sp. MFO224 TaxID=3378070 RepID=UPI00385508CD